MFLTRERKTEDSMEFIFVSCGTLSSLSRKKKEKRGRERRAREGKQKKKK
jgi:hypothetical protein